MINKKRIIGYTTGVFDLFHMGHLNILRQSKDYCDYLIVGVSTDELVQKYKNKNPIIPFAERFEIVSSIKYVDHVVVQSDRDKFRAYKELNFDIMFVGDDWKGKKIFVDLEKDFVDHGVQIRYFPYTKNVSSSILREILHQIKKNENRR